MTHNTPVDPDKEPDAALDELLRDALRSAPLDAPALERIRAATMREWHAATDRARIPAVRVRRSWMLALAAAASIAGVAVIGVVTRSVAEPAVVGTLARLPDGAIEAHWAIVRRRPLHVGDALRVGDTITAQGPALVSLTGGGTLRIAAGAVIQVADKALLSLQQGLVYVDIPPAPAAGANLRLKTRAGLIEHLGTEFEVLSNDQLVRIRVREGRIRLLDAAGGIIAGQGTEILAEPGRPVSRRAIDTFGPDWSWAVSLAPAFDTDGRPLVDFLQWTSRELGRHLEFADPHAREVAERTVLHGSVRGDNLLESLANVLETTSLSYEIQAGAIRVHSGP
ncbi:MAG: FecR domain-containing protein [Steroidobacterales bacterium]